MFPSMGTIFWLVRAVQAAFLCGLYSCGLANFWSASVGVAS